MNISSCDQKILRRKRHLRLLNVDADNIRTGAKNNNVGIYMDSAGSIYSELSGCCAHENKVHCFMKIWEYLDQEINCHFLKYAFHVFS
jgi:hypothetical protein